MVENNNNQELEPNGGIDRFSRFMFGNRKHRETYHEGEINSQESPELNERSSLNNRMNRREEGPFGFRRKEPTSHTNTAQNQIENLLNNVDIDLLMETTDMFVSTFKQFKPLFKDIAPLLKRFTNKLNQ
ncbi:hypothetical protein ABES02_04155 [Neobacillus pocheonensis]|uniref:hypothetical protein n=1 Tax=Neobacillus pocheonensis TaxID=363869 RepID=UPI003D2DB830